MAWDRSGRSRHTDITAAFASLRRTLTHRRIAAILQGRATDAGTYAEGWGEPYPQPWHYNHRHGRLITVPAHEHEIKELLQSEPHETATDGQPSYSSLLQPLWHGMQDSHALLNTTMDAILDKT